MVPTFTCWWSYANIIKKQVTDATCNEELFNDILFYLSRAGSLLTVKPDPVLR
jgi:hypothetical protein